MRHLLVIDDEVGSRISLQAILGSEYQVTTAADSADGLEALSREPIDLILLGVHEPSRDGLPMLRKIRAVRPGVPVVMIGVSNSLRQAVARLNGDVCECVIKPFTVPEIKRIVTRSLLATHLRQRVTALETSPTGDARGEELVGTRGSLRHAVTAIREHADSDRPFVFEGERGTGREALARLAHAFACPAGEPFLRVSCARTDATVVDELLFGSESGDTADPQDVPSAGRLEQAGAGLLYLEDADRLPDATQELLADTLERGALRRIGGHVDVPTRARIAFGITLSDGQSTGLVPRVRQALTLCTVTLPPLRERAEDIPDLCRHFMARQAGVLGAQVVGFADKALKGLQAYGWPGNIRELANVVERILMLHGGATRVTLDMLPSEIRGAESAAGTAGAKVSLEAAVNRYEKALIENALAASNGVQTQAAQELGTTRRILRYRMDKLNIRLPSARRRGSRS